MNLLVLLEVADRLSLKNDLEIARDIQQAMLPSGTYRAPGVETFGMSRPANTVGGDFYDILPLADGRLVIALGDVAGKGSPGGAADGVAAGDAAHAGGRKARAGGADRRGSTCRSAATRRARASSRCSTASSIRATGELTYVNAGQMPPLLLRADGTIERLTDGGIALGMFEQSDLHDRHDGDRAGRSCSPSTATASPKRRARPACRSTRSGSKPRSKASRLAAVLPRIGAAVVRAVEQHTDARKFVDDLTILLLRRCPMPPPPASEIETHVSRAARPAKAAFSRCRNGRGWCLR